MPETTVVTRPSNELLTSSAVNGRLARRRTARRGSSESACTWKPDFLLNTFRKRWTLVVPAGLGLATVLVAVVYSSFEPVYEASAWVRIQETTPYVAFQSREYSRSFSETQVQLIRSPVVFSAVVADPKAAGLVGGATEEAKVRWLARNVQVQPVGESELVKIFLQTTSPTRSAHLVNAVAHAYLKSQDQDNADRTDQIVEQLEKEREARSQEVDRLRNKVRELTEQVGEQPGTESESALARNTAVADLQNRLATAKLEYEMLKAQVDTWEQSLAAERLEVPDALLEAAIDEHAEVQHLNDTLSEKRLKLNEIAAKSALGDKHPLYQQLSHEIRAYEETLQRLYTELREVVRPSLERQLIRERKEELTKLQADLAKRTITVQTLQRSLATHLTETRQLSGQGVELEQQRAELARATETLGLLTKRLIELRTERHAPQRISLMKAAIVPTEPVEWMPTQKMGLAWLLGLVAPYGLALVWERTLRRVSNAEELEELCNLAILAETPRLPDSVRPTDTATAERHSLDLAMFDESIDSLRSCLMLAEPLKHLRVLAVTSGSSKEGKTSVATKLASSLARATGEDVLLIDGDARLPDIHDLFGIPLEPGLTEVLSGRVAIGDAIQTTSCPGLHVLPAGRLPSSPHQVFRNQSVEALLGDLRSSYRYIVIDTAPVLAASETLSLAKAADTCVVCARWDFSRVDQVRAACERLLAADVNPAGIVLNGMPSTNYAFRYGGYGYAYAWPRTATPDRSANPQPHESSAKVAV